MNKAKEKNVGITLVALVVTIVVLLILAGITIVYVFGDNGVLGQASEAKIKTEIAKAKEKIEVVLNEAKIPKHTDSKYNENEYLDEFILNRLSDTEVLDEIIITDGYAFLLDRSVPKIGEYLGKKEELVFPTVAVSEVNLAGDTKSATFTITANEETKGINRIEIWLSGVKLDTIEGKNEKNVTHPYTVTRNGVYTIKAYADLSASATVNVVGIIPSVEFTPNGNTEWKKQHTTKVTIKEAVTSLKYKWTKDGINPPSLGEFTEECLSDRTITGGDDSMTGSYYLWVLLTVGTGENQKTNICGSQVFNFDNTAPTAEIATEWIEEETRNRLKITVRNAQDELSGVNENVKVYVTPENKAREEKSLKLINGTGEIIVDGLEMESLTTIEVSVLDNAGNLFSLNKKVGRMYLIKNGKILGPISTSGTGSKLVENDDGTVTISANAEGRALFRGWSGVEFEWTGGRGKFCGTMTKKGHGAWGEGISKLMVIESSNLPERPNSEDGSLGFDNRNLREIDGDIVVNFGIPFECRT